MKVATVPNLICVLRIALTVPIVMLLVEGRYGLTLVLFAIAAVSDVLDGFLAKTFGWTSELGKLLDPLADKLLLVTVFSCLSVAGLSPWWLTAVVLLRDLVIIFGAIVYRALFGALDGQPTLRSKLNTVCQIVFCLVVVMRAAYGWPAEPVVTTLGALVLVTTAVSGVDYVLIYVRRAAAVARARAAAAR